MSIESTPVHYRHVDADGVRVFYREAGAPDAPLLLLLHGYPTSSHMYRELIRECEHPDCVLWFYDRTKSHRRRWCSMALCGNRHKVAEFRKRQHA